MDINEILKLEDTRLDMTRAILLSYELAEAHAVKAIEQLAVAIEILGDQKKVLDPDIRSRFIVDSLKIATDFRDCSRKLKKMVSDQIQKVKGEKDGK